LHQLYGAVTRNRFYFNLNWPLASKYADYAKSYYNEDSLLTIQYHNIANGKWNHMMDQTHIGYTYWQQPQRQRMPEVKYVSLDSQQLAPGELLGTYSSKDLIPKNVKDVVFYELDGIVSIESSHWTRTLNSKNIQWKVIPDIGKDGDGITTFPVTAKGQKPNGNTPHLEYEIYIYDSGQVKLNAYFSPTLNFHNDSTGLKYGISIDNEQPQIVSINKDDNNQRTWEQWVANNIIIKTSNHTVTKPGEHTINFWMVSPAVILQKIVIDFGGVKPSYLGPPETVYKK